MTPLLVRRLAPLVFIAAIAFAAAACEKPDASDTTSPSALSLVGTTTGAVTFRPEGTPPDPVPPPEGWEFELGNARFSTLENREPSIQVVVQVESKPGPGLEFWLTGPEGQVFRWSGGSTRRYDGVVCFQFRLEDDDAALPLVPGNTYHLTMAFRDPGDESIVAARTVTVAGRVPDSTKPAPGPGSTVVRDLLGCPRSVI